MAVDNDVDHVLFHNTDVGSGVNGLRSAEQNVGEFGAHHGAAPAVRKAGAQRLLDECLGQRRTSHMGHVQRLRNLAVDGARLNAGVVPQLLRVLRSALQETLDAEGLAILEKSGFSNFVRQSVDVLVFGFNVPFVSDSLQLFGVLDLIRTALFCLIQGVADLTAMVGVRC